MSILEKVKIGSSVQINLELSKDRFTKDIVDAINFSSVAKIKGFRITDGKGIGVILQLSNLEKLYAKFATAWFRFKLIINSCDFRLVRAVFCILESINNFNKKNCWSNFQKIIIIEINQ